MATKVHMEALSPTMEEGQVVAWLKGEGDPVAQGDVLAEIETDKATMELVARGDGVLRAVFAGEGDVVPVGEVIAVIAGTDEEIAALTAEAWSGGGKAAATTAPTAATVPASSPPPLLSASVQDSAPEASAPKVPAEVPAEPPAAPAPAPTARIKASPVARRLARELEVELGAIAGSGPGGRVVKRDVEAAAQAAAEAAPAAPRAQRVTTFDVVPSFAADARPGAPVPDFEDVPLTQMRKTVARRLVESLGPVPHFFLTVDVDMGRAIEARARVNELLAADGGKASLNDLVIKAVAAALARHPECNAWWQGDRIRRFNRVHVGVAVAVPDGLITPVIRDAHAKGLAQIGAEVRELAGRAREKRLQPHEYTGSTFSISNLGMFGIDEFTAVINPPEAGILAVGAVEERPVVIDGQVVPRPRMRLTMSCDHRAIDGAQGARFLATLKTFLEEPAAILL